MNRIDAAELRRWLIDGGELGLLDAREQGVFNESHLFHAACVPLSRLELMLPDLVPRQNTRMVWCDGGGETGTRGLASRAADRAAALGWTNCWVLEGGIRAWAGQGGELYSGVNVPSKAFGEFVEHTYDTPRIRPVELSGLIEAGADLVVLDSRPIEEFRNMSIPTGVDCPGAELVHRVKEVVDDPETLIVVNCAGRTRSIIGAQSLINAGIENRVVALENGTMGWELAGLAVAHGRDVHAPDPGPSARRWSEAAARRVGKRFGVEVVGFETVAQWLAEDDRTTYLLDVRTPDEFAAGHLTGSRNAPGGQLVQATDEYVAIRNARLALIDDTGVRATMTASWLRQLGWSDAFVVTGALEGRSLGTVDGPEPAVAEAVTITSADLAADSRHVTVLDVDSSLQYRRGHVPGAWWGVRSRLHDAHRVIGDVARLVVTSRDGRLASWAVADALRYWPRTDVVALEGGTRAWSAAGHPIETGFERATTRADDVWYKPYDHDDGAAAQHMRDYLTWEIALVDQLARDPTVEFPRF